MDGNNFNNDDKDGFNDEFSNEENNNEDYVSRSHELTEEEKTKVIENSEVNREPSRENVYREEDKPKKKSGGSLFSYIVIALIAALIGGLVSPYIGSKLYGSILPNPQGNNQYTASPVVINTADDITTVSAVAKKSVNSVVGITTIEQVQQDNWFMPEQVEGVGTGVIIDSNGYILTNSHVVRDGQAQSIHVLFENGEKLEGELLWNEPILDLAIVKVDKTGLPAAELGDSDDLVVGEAAIAIGNPLGLEYQRTVTSGIISGLNRSIQIENRVIEDLIQTDASINRGNSGGPLLNSNGEVIGINTAKIQSGEGLGFSIPINEAKIIIEEVIENGSFETVFLGVSGIAVQDYEARLDVEIGVENGLVLIQVAPGTPAEVAGLQDRDVVTKIDDVEIDSMSRLKKTLYKYKKGDKAEMTVIRNNQEQQIEIQFTEVR